MARGKNFDLKNQQMTKNSIRIFGISQKLGKTFMVFRNSTYRHHILNVPRKIISYSNELF